MDLQTVHKKKQPSKFAPIQQSVSHFFSKSVKKLPPESNIQSSEAETKISASSLALEKVDFIKDCPVFSSGDPKFGYDIVLAVVKRNQLSDGVKYQVLTHGAIFLKSSSILNHSRPILRNTGGAWLNF